MENQRVDNNPSSKFTWRIENFSKLNTQRHYSEIFSIGSHKWRLLVFPKGYYVDHLSLYLDAADAAQSPYAKFSLVVVNQINDNDTVRKDTHHQFTVGEKDWGFKTFMPLSELNDPHRGYIVNDTCIVEVEFTLDSTYDSKKAITAKSTEAKQSVEPAPFPKYPFAGQLFRKGRHRGQGVVLDDEKFEDIGGFSILKTQASLYEQIWLKYGHISSSQVLKDYSAQVMLVSDIMTSIMDMHDCHLAKVSSSMLDLWEKKIKMAEKLEFNIRWLRERFEDVKKDFYGKLRLKTKLLEQDQSLLAAMAQLTEVKVELKKVQENLSAIETMISPMLSERQIMNLEKDGGLLFDGLF